MKTQALKALSKGRSSSRKAGAQTGPQAGLESICQRYGDNPFVRFLRAAFFFDEAVHAGGVPARAPGAAAVGLSRGKAARGTRAGGRARWHGTLKF
jgi:hypothetical protein